MKRILKLFGFLAMIGSAAAGAYYYLFHREKKPQVELYFEDGAMLSLPESAAAEPIIARKPKSFRIRFILQPPPPLHLHPLHEYHACRSSCHRTPTLRDYPSCRLPGYPCSAPQSPAPGICIPDRSEPSTGSTLPHPCLGSVLPPACSTPEPYRPCLSGCQRGNERQESHALRRPPPCRCPWRCQASPVTLSPPAHSFASPFPVCDQHPRTIAQCRPHDAGSDLQCTILSLSPIPPTPRSSLIQESNGAAI